MVYKILHGVNITFVFTAFVFLIISMCTNYWKKNEHFMSPLIGDIGEVHNGLWYTCKLGLCDPIPRIRTKDGDDQAYRGNLTRGLMGLAIWMSWNSFMVMIISFCLKYKAHRNLLIANLVFLFIAFVSGLAALSNYTNRFPTDLFLPDYGYSYVLGWAGSCILILSLLMSITQMFMAKRNNIN